MTFLGLLETQIDSYFEIKEKNAFIDTAGLRKKSKISGDIEFYSSVRAMGAIDRADVVLMVLDASQNISEQDKRIAGIAHEAGKAIIVIVNKWDLIEKDSQSAGNLSKKIKAEFAIRY